MSLRRSLILSLGRSGGQSLIQFGTNIVLARLLSPAEIGAFLVGWAAILTLYYLRDFGVPRYLIKERELTPAKLSTVFGVALIMSWTIGAALYLGRGAIADLYGSKELGDILAVLALMFLLMPVGQPALAMLRREQRHGDLAVAGLSASVCGSATSITLAVMGFGPISMAYGALVSNLVWSCIALWFKPDHIRLLPSLSEWRSVLGFGSISVIGEIVVQLEYHAPSLLLGKLLGLAETGIFQRGNSLAGVVVSMVMTSTTWVTGAAMGARHRSGDSVSALAVKTTDYLSAFCWPALAFLALKSDAIIYLLYGKAWLASAPLLPPLCIAAAIMIFGSQNTAVYEATGAVGLHLRNHAIALVVVVILLVIGAQYGLLVAAWLRVPAIAVRELLHFAAMRRYAEIRPLQMALELKRAFLVTAGFAAAVMLMIQFEPDGAEHRLSILAIETVASGFIYLAMLQVFGHPLGREMTRFSRGLVLRR